MQTTPPWFRHALLIGALLCVSGIAQAQAPAAPLAVESARPERGSVDRWITLPGGIKPLQQATLYAKVPGYLQSISVDKGDSVKAGAVLAVLETPELSADLARYQAENDATRAEYERIQQAIQRAPDLVMPVELDRAKGRYDVARANLERTQSLLAFGSITAPFAGIVTQRFVDVGAFIPAATAGSTAQTAAVVTLMDFSTVRVQVAVPEAEAPLVKRGLPARVSASSLPGRNFTGTITRFAYALDDSSKTMMVEIELPNPKLDLRPGMYVSVQLALQRHENVLLIPAAALVMEKTNAFVYTVNGGVARKRPIKTGFNDGTRVEVQEGVTADDSVILVGKKALSDGMAIQATEAR